MVDASRTRHRSTSSAPVMWPSDAASTSITVRRWGVQRSPRSCRRSSTALHGVARGRLTFMSASLLLQRLAIASLPHGDPMTQLLALAGFGFLLGMRHATDADHVIAVTTILNRSRRFLDTTLIGALWGLGHTITVLIVGTLIIVFNVVIPPPVGLAMEFAVALMLIALGILNLTGSLSW